MGNSAEKAIRKIETLDRKIKPLEFEASAILQSSGVGQAPPIYHRTLDKIIMLKEKQAQIWNNELRGMLIDSKETFWQRALRFRLPVVWFGYEGMLNFSGKEIRALIDTKETRGGRG